MYKDFRKDKYSKYDNKPKEKFVHPKNFISNLSNTEKELILKAAKMANCSIYIEEKGYNLQGHQLKDTISIYSCIEGQDLSGMWIKYNELKEII